jgi:hypothetical protein
MPLTFASDNRGQLLYQDATSGEQFHATIEITVSEKIYYYQSTKNSATTSSDTNPPTPQREIPTSEQSYGTL